MLTALGIDPTKGETGFAGSSSKGVDITK